MDSLSYMIKKEMMRQYGTVAAFSRASGIPYMTCSNAIKRGIDSMAYGTVIQICNILGIKQTMEDDVVIFNRDFHDIYTKLTQLDKKGVHTVVTLLNIDYQRCMEEGKGLVQGYNGIGYVQKNAFDEKQVLELVRRAKKREK